MMQCSEKAFAACPTRHLCGSRSEATFAENSECAEFNRRVESAPMTNADKIRAMADAELAKVIACPEGIAGRPCRDAGCELRCYDCCLEWLRQPVKEGSL